ncbi:MAG: hypothetical protein KJO07_26125, partial [Deltaproteobacteria bacterium]|nr:hypothetical protein [Deltaproteobacteria bacterium]
PRGPHIDHQFRISTGYSRGENSQDNGESSTGDVNLYGFRFEGRLAALSDYLKPGTRAKGFHDGNLTTLQARHVRAGSGTGTSFLADTMLLGWRQEQVDDDGTGLGVAIGTAVAVRYQRERWDGWFDRLGAIHLPGLGINSVVRGRGWSLRTVARAHADYAGVHASSYPRWVEGNPMEVGKTVLEREGYYYAWGLSGRFRADLEVSRFGLGTSLFYGQYRSQQNFDRFQSMLTVDQIGRKGFFDYSVWLRAQLYGTSYLEVRRMGQQRSSTFEDLEASGSQTRHTIELGTTF